MKEVVKLKPYIKSAIWGSTYFKKYFQTELSNIAELWTLSVRGDFSSQIDSGSDKGKYLNEVITKEDIGPVADRFPFFPLLVKLIDAKENLSVQVHPSDAYALKNLNSFGKTEMWHILSAKPGSGLYVGLNKDYSKEEIESKLKDNSILDALNFFEVKPGDTFLINAGTIHAIGEGVTLIEIQQNSDITYRLYDYLRKDKDGNYRQLHIDEALKVIDYHKYQQEEHNGEYLEDTPYFKVKKVVLNKELTLKADKDSFITFTFISGKGKVDDIDYDIYDTFYLPYGKSCKIKGEGTLIISSL